MEIFIKTKSFNKKINNIYPYTKIKGSLFFTLGGVKSPISKESINLNYENKIRLTTSFNGSDKLLTVFESGNAFTSPLNLDLESKKGDTISIATLLYQFPLKEKFEITIGPKMFGYNGLAGKSTAYNERIAILDGSNFTTATGIGSGIALATKRKTD